MGRHLGTLAALHGLWASLQLVMGLMLGAFMLLASGGMIAAGMGGGDDELVFLGGFYGVFSLMAAGMPVLLSIPGFLAAYGLARRTPWARLVGLIQSGLMVMSFPLGTALGAYSLYVLLDAEVAAELAAQA